MSKTAQVLNLGVIGAEHVEPFPGTADRPAGAAPVERAGRWPDPGPRVAGSMSLFLPGTGQLLRGETMNGLFVLSTIGFFGALSWALLSTFERLAGTLRLFHLSIGLVFWTLVLAYSLAGAIHIAGVLNASIEYRRRRPVFHPAIPGVCSAIVPGWGQLMNGDRRRAALFLGFVWFVGGAWLITSARTTGFLNEFIPTVPAWEQALRQPIFVWTAQWTLPAVVWCLAIYDAAASAAARR